MSLKNADFQEMLNYSGKSAHFPKLSNLLEAMYYLMTATQYSSINKLNLYPYLLNLASFASELLQSEFVFQAAHLTAPQRLPQPTLAAALQNYSFLSRAQVVQMASNVLMKEYTPKTEKIIGKLLRTFLVEKQIKHVFFPSEVEFQYKQYFDFQLDLTSSFLFLLVHLFLHNCLLESFDCHRDVVFRHFQLKELVFNAAAAGEYVTFWWPAFSFDEQCVFQARYTQAGCRDESQLDGDSSFLEDVCLRTGAGPGRRADPGGGCARAAPETGVPAAAESQFGVTIPVKQGGASRYKQSQIRRQQQSQQCQTAYSTVLTKDQLFEQQQVIPQAVDYERVEELIKQKTYHLAEKLEALEKQAEASKQNNIVLNANLKKLNGDFQKLYDVVQEMNKTIVSLANRQMDSRRGAGLFGRTTNGDLHTLNK